MKLKDITIVDLKTYAPELYEQVRNTVDPEDVVNELKEKLEREKSLNEKHMEKRRKLHSKLEKACAKIENLMSELDKFEAAKRLAEKEELVDRLIKESEIVKELVSDIFKEQLMKLDDEEKMKELIEDRKALRMPKGKVTESGDEFIVNDTKPKKKVTEEDQEEVLEALGIE